MTSRKKGLKSIASLALLCFVALCRPHAADAQRTMKDQDLICVKGYSALTGIRDAGGELCWGRYLLSAYWRVTAEGGVFHRDIKTSHRLKTCSVTLDGAYMHRLVSTRSRSVSLYAGGGAFIGYEFYDPTKHLPEFIDTKLPSGTFLYGIFPEVEGEFFFCRKVAFVVYAKIPVNFSSPLGKVRFRAGAGLRINL